MAPAKKAVEAKLGKPILPVRVKSAAKAPSTEDEIRASALQWLHQMVINSNGKVRHVRYVCQYHKTFNPDLSPAGVLPQGANAGGNVYHEIEVNVPDSAAVSAVKEILDRTEGKAAQQKTKEPPKRDGSRLEDLTDEELSALLDAEE